MEVTYLLGQRVQVFRHIVAEIYLLIHRHVCNISFK